MRPSSKQKYQPKLRRSHLLEDLNNDHAQNLPKCQKCTSILRPFFQVEFYWREKFCLGRHWPWHLFLHCYYQEACHFKRFPEYNSTTLESCHTGDLNKELAKSSQMSTRNSHFKYIFQVKLSNLLKVFYAPADLNSEHAEFLPSAWNEWPFQDHLSIISVPNLEELYPGRPQ